MKYSTGIGYIPATFMAIVAIFALNPATAADAGAMPMNHAEEHAEAEAVRAKGVVQSVDAAANTVTLAHEAIPDIGWPAMTMAFKVAGNAEEQVKAGDSVEFELKGEGSDYTISRIEKVE